VAGFGYGLKVELPMTEVSLWVGKGEEAGTTAWFLAGLLDSCMGNTLAEDEWKRVAGFGFGHIYFETQMEMLSWQLDI
jgi:hypothetical protein